MSQSPDMRNDAELLSYICDNTPVAADRVMGINVMVTVKLLASWTSLSVQTISEYRSGVRNIPISFWRAILTRWCHPGIVALLIPDDYEVELTDFKEPLPRTSPQFFRNAVEESGKFSEKQMHLANILADGRIDDLDRSDVLDYHDAYFKQRHASGVLHRAVMAKYDEYAEKGGVS